VGQSAGGKSVIREVRVGRKKVVACPTKGGSRKKRNREGTKVMRAKGYEI